jgi:hypothetical protein
VVDGCRGVVVPLFLQGCCFWGVGVFGCVVWGQGCPCFV